MGERIWGKILGVLIGIFLMLTIGCSNNNEVNIPEMKVTEWGNVQYEGTYYIYAILSYDNYNERVKTIEKVKVGSANILEQYAIKGISDRSPEAWEKQVKLNVPLELKPRTEYNIILSSEDNELLKQLDKFGMDIYFNDYRFSVGP